MIHIPILYQNGPVEVETLVDSRREEYALRTGAVRVEFSEVEEIGRFLRLHTSEGFSRMTVRHGTGCGDIRDDVKDVLLGL